VSATVSRGIRRISDQRRVELEDVFGRLQIALPRDCSRELASIVAITVSPLLPAASSRSAMRRSPTFTIRLTPNARYRNGWLARKANVWPICPAVVSPAGAVLSSDTGSPLATTW
jgi:hypothetical protein